MNSNPPPQTDRDVVRASAADSADRQQQLAEAVQRYLTQFEQGKLPDRSVLLAEHPELAEELAACLASLDFIHHAAPGLTGQGPAEFGTTSVGEPLSAALGDFRILHEIGRGGMGVVYEAEQISLRRRVALKVLPFAAMLDPHQLQRFQNEARAAATLSHPRIVPVHYVGVERGVHFFAMQLIEGCSLAQAIKELRGSTDTPAETAPEPSASVSRPNAQAGAEPKAPTVTGAGRAESAVTAPTAVSDDTRRAIQALRSTRTTGRSAEYCRQVARLGLQAAEALEYAHSHGIVHRDIKPANLLLDIEQNVWLTDFGLARLASEATATVTGDVLGTLRYMSPEQARGDRHGVDPRSDIYALGATLYELLTFSPLVEGADRQEILQRIAAVEAKPLRQCDKSIPADLETIVLTAVNKDAADRYASAQQLADDLRRFLDNQAIRARRPSLVQRLGRWSRRYRRALTLATVLLVMALTVSTLICVRAYSIAEQQRKQAELERSQAQQSMALAIAAVDQMYADVVSSWLASDTVLSTLQQQYLQQASSTYERIIRTMPENVSKRELVGRLWERIGSIRLKLDETDQARDAIEQAIARYQTLVEASSNDPSLRHRLAVGYNNLSVSLNRLGRSKEALESLDAGCQHLQQLVDRFPDERKYQYDLAGNDLNHAVYLLFSLGQPTQAEAWARQSQQRLQGLGPANWQDRRQRKDFDVTASMILLQAKVCLAQALRYQERIEDCRQECREGLGLCSFLRIDYRDHPNVTVAEDLLTRELAELELLSNQPEEAVRHFRRSLELQVDQLRAKVKPSQWLTKYVFAELTRDQLSEAATVRDEGYEEPRKFCEYVETQIRLAHALKQIGRVHEAEQVLAEAEEISGYLTDCYGDVRYRVAWTNSCAELALLLDQVRPTEAKMARERATSIWWLALQAAPLSRQHRSGLHALSCDFDWFAATFPDCLSDALPKTSARDKPTDRPPVFYFHNWGIQDLEAELYADAVQRLSRAAQQRSESHAFDWLYLAWAHWKLDQKDKAREWFDKADQWIQQQAQQDVELDELRNQVAQIMSE